MTEQEVKLVVGGLLHDIGKVIYRTGDGRKHSQSGYDFLKEELQIDDREILDSVRYHHSDALRHAELTDNSFAYITYIADNIASAADRRKKEAVDYGFEMSAPLQPVFNILNGSHKEMYYSPMMLEPEINYPTEAKKAFDETFYQNVRLKLKESLQGIEWTEEFINSLLEVLEALLSFVPSSTAKDEVADISLYDHVKLTAAVGSCIFQHLQEQSISNYREYLYQNANEFYDKKAFLLYSIDLSGIQAFIYTIHTKDALKMLRARSFYLEIMMEHIIDTVLDRVNLSRANLIYSGGGHCYILLPNTEEVKQTIAAYDRELNRWLMETFDISLYAVSAYVETSANIMKNVPENSYEEMFRELSNCLSSRKAHRYSASDILWLNRRSQSNYTRECVVCKRLEQVDENGTCRICRSLKAASKDILYQPFFVIVREGEEDGVPLPGDCYMIAETEQKLRQRMAENRESFLRVYSKNKFYTGLNVATKIWVGDYTKGQTFEELATASEGIHRLGVFRADVDNLGQTFVSGFDKKYRTLSRTAALSRQLSVFFKYYINGLLEGKNRNATIVYSGGDDMFLVGAWNEVIELALDIRNAFLAYSGQSLTLSAGIGIYDSRYPISRMAVEVGDYEDQSKQADGKDAVTLLPDVYKATEEKKADRKSGEHEMIYKTDSGTYKWNIFQQQVLGEKYELVEHFFERSEERGKVFLYHLLELIRDREETINFARYVYILARLEPGPEAPEQQKELYRQFSKQMYEWMQTKEDSRQLKTAMNLYAYRTREREGEQA